MFLCQFRILLPTGKLCKFNIMPHVFLSTSNICVSFNFNDDFDFGVLELVSEVSICDAPSFYLV